MRRGLLTLLGVAVLSGCASVERSTLASRFIRQGTPTVDLGGPRVSGGRSERGRPPLNDAAITTNVSRSSGVLSSFESVDGRLRDALMRVRVAPTVEHHLDVARHYRAAGIFDKAHDYLSRSLALNGPDPIVYDERARLWRDWGGLDHALSDAYRAVYLRPQAAALQNTLGTILYRLGERREAEFRFQHALTLDANAWYAIANLCHLNLARGRTRDAIIQCRQATAVRDQNSK